MVALVQYEDTGTFRRVVQRCQCTGFLLEYYVPSNLDVKQCWESKVRIVCKRCKREHTLYVPAGYKKTDDEG